MQSVVAYLAKPAFQKAARNIGWLLGDRVARAGVSFITGILLMRYLGPEEYGSWIYAGSFAALFLPLSTLGLERIAVREFARDPSAQGAVLGTVGVLRLAGGAMGALLAVACLPSVGVGADVRVVVALMAGANALLAFEGIDWWFQSRERFGPTTAVRCLAFVVGSTARVVLAWQRAPLEWLAIAMLGEFSVSALLQLVVGLKWGGLPSGVQASVATARSLLHASAPLLLAEIAVLGLLKLDVVILGAHGAAAETGLYGAATRLVQVTFFVPVILTQLLSPAMARCVDAARALALAQRITNGLFAGSLVLAAGLALGAPWLVHFLLGDHYAGAPRLVAVLAWTTVFAFLGTGHSLYLINRGHQRTALALNLCSAITTVALFALLIPRWGAMGAAAAGVLAGALSTIPPLALFRESRPLLRIDGRAIQWTLTLPLRLVRQGFSRVDDQ